MYVCTYVCVFVFVCVCVCVCVYGVRILVQAVKPCQQNVPQYYRLRLVERARARARERERGGGGIVYVFIVTNNVWQCSLINTQLSVAVERWYYMWY
jgi:hypothetical protein